jgi:hypothetical protein
MTGESMLSGVPSVPFALPLSLPPPQPAMPPKTMTPKAAHFPQRVICISLLLNWIRRRQKQLLCLSSSQSGLRRNISESEPKLLTEEGP